MIMGVISFAINTGQHNYNTEIWQDYPSWLEAGLLSVQVIYEFSGC